ncbi:hypothetical protein A2W14_02530 [Candidatus Gottesmanbacteria bacterium RBG_16_37_8]|uniref:Sulfatase N-terminal domain-containing protein n=1 Tax=Candidatus Gottesmanbacteria bacterium RBG_16_37_8 TaxID=1798371 RepID=A0A1F5YQ39_9BACT|nr:MAG: hypothetical protein A2W14_02530 [Candidatus Gottesmanbacteria bacterium RBG_16_37_8]
MPKWIIFIFSAFISFTLFLYLLINPKLIYAVSIENLTQAQQEALNKASLADEDLQELIDYAPDLLNLEYIFRTYSAQSSPLAYNPGDANGDGKVDGLDYVIWLNNYNKTVTNGAASGDFDINGKVDGLDYVIWLNNYHKIFPTPTPTLTTSPSPSATLTPNPTITPTPSASPNLSPTPSPVRPNIVLIISDDQRYESLKKMPYLNQLLATNQWSKFTNAYTNVSLCCPSRVAMLTGQYSHHTLVEDNLKMRLFNENDNLVTGLHNSGYNTALIGKYLNGWTINKPLNTPPGWDVFTPFTVAAYYNYKLYNHGVLTSYAAAESDYSTDVLGQKAVDYLKTAKQPFFLHFSPFTPHLPYTPAPRHANADVGNIILTPDFNEADVSDKPAWIQALPLRNQILKEDIIRNQYRMLLSLDEWINKMYLTLDQRGLLSNTVIIFIGDNSIAHGEHRFISKICGYDICNQVPLLIRFPFTSGGNINNLVSNIDIAPTIAEIAQISLNKPDGLSLVPLLRGQSTLNRNGLLIRWAAQDPAYNIPAFWGIIKWNWKYMELETGEKELYNRLTDPYELNNVAGKPENAQLEIALHNDLMSLLNQ